jgi:hypothetical protein
VCPAAAALSKESKMSNGAIYIVTQEARYIDVLNASNRPRVYVAGEVYEQKLVGRLASRRKAHKVGSFPELPGSIMARRAKRLTQVVQERGIGKTLVKVFSTK